MYLIKFRFLMLLLVVLSACTDQTNKKPDAAAFESNIEMASRLKSIQDSLTFEGNWYLSELGLKVLSDARKQTELPVQNKLIVEFYHPIQYLNLGRNEEAIEGLNDFIAFANSLNTADHRIDSMARHFRQQAKRFIAVAHLRSGEVANCLKHHHEESCIFPFSAKGEHRITEGSAAAIKIYEQILDQHPDDLQSIWLYNVAHLTLGQHPDSVRVEFLIDPNKFQAKTQLKRFKNTAPMAGVAHISGAGGSISEDFDNDGDIDLISSSFGLDQQLHYYENDGTGNFTDMTEKAGLLGITGGINLNHADVNNDGFADVFVMRGGWLSVFGPSAGNMPNSLLINDGHGRFVDQTMAYGLYELSPTLTACWGDVNADGWLDLFVGAESVDEHIRFPSKLYVNREGKSFEPITSLKIDSDIKGADFGDIDNDGDLDLFVSVYMSENLLFENRSVDQSGIPQFVEVSKERFVTEPAASFSCFFFDFNQDGWQDIYISSYPDLRNDGDFDLEVASEFLGQPTKLRPYLFQNTGNGKFEEIGLTAGLNRKVIAMGLNYGDIDNDGWLDIYHGTGAADFRALMPNLIFRNVEGKFYEDVTTSTGLGHLQKGHGISFADIDQDGDQDIYHSIGGFLNADVYPNALFINPGNANKWLCLQFQGRKSNRKGQHNRVTISTYTNGKLRNHFFTVGTGGSFGSSSLQVEAGLGKADRIESIEVQWAGSGLVQHLKSAELNRGYLVIEGDDELRELKD